MIELSFDDGCESDIRAAALCSKYEVPATFYWPVEHHSLAYEKGYKPLKHSDAEQIAQQFTIGSHTITHRHLTKLLLETAQYEIRESKTILQKMFNQPIDSFCPPRGYINDTLETYALNYYDDIRLTRGDNLVHIHPDSGANGNIPWQKRAKQVGGDIHLWGHSYELDRFDLWKELEDWLENSLR